MDTLAWEVFEGHLHSQNPVSLNMGGSRDVYIGFHPETRSMFIRLPVNPGLSIPPNPYAELEVSIKNDETGSILEITTQTERLFREFHRFAGIITEDFEEPKQTAMGAFEIAIHRWQELTSQKELLTNEQQLGLLGELVFLRALMEIQGSQSVQAWTGRKISNPERHDFRIAKMDIEIKSTQSSHRRHVIHGLHQLQPALGHDLFILSIKFESAGLGTGRSLVDEVEYIRSSMAKSAFDLMEFNNSLLSAGYHNEDSEHYQRKLVLADQPILVSVDDICPKITSEMVSKMLTPNLAGRIEDVSYRINIEGLGFEQNSVAFANILGKIRLTMD